MSTAGGFFVGLKKSFADVSIDKSNNNAIPTTDFLEAAESLATLFGAYLSVEVLNGEC